MRWYEQQAKQDVKTSVVLQVKMMEVVVRMPVTLLCQRLHHQHPVKRVCSAVVGGGS